MSSHHIVRDEQEPALLALHAGWLANETLASLLEWSPTIIVPAAEVELLTTLGFKPDVVVATSEERRISSANWDTLAPLTVLERKESEDGVVSALHYLLAGKYKAVNIFATPFELNLGEFELFLANMDIVFYTEQSRWLWVRNGQYSKWLPAGSCVTVRTIGESQEFTIDGFVQNETSVVADKRVLEAKKDDWVTIRSKKAFLLEEQL